MHYKFRTDRFNWHKDTGVFSAEASDFNRYFTSMLHNGFSLLSNKGNIVNFEFASLKRDCEGDILFWNFSAEDRDLVKLDIKQKLMVRIFND